MYGQGKHHADLVMIMNTGEADDITLQELLTRCANIGYDYHVFHYFACRVEHDAGGWKTKPAEW